MRPKFHYTPKSNWLNDPNGLCYYKGQYHMYYQYNPMNPYWGNMSWGHATSIDMASWTEHEVAMRPSIPYDMDGCFSGSALPMGDRILYAYTGIRYGDSMTNEHGNEVPVTSEGLKPVQLFAESLDGFEIIKNESLVIYPPEGISAHEFRDPKLFEKNHKYYFIVAAAKEEAGGILIYESQDLSNWSLFREHFFEDRGVMWECPDYFEIDGQGIIIYSAIGIDHMGLKDAIGWSTYDFDSGEMGAFNLMEFGDVFYAPQTLQSKTGKRICIGWLKTGEPYEGQQWSGMMSVPRVLTYWDNALHQWPHSSIESYVTDVERIAFVSGRFSFGAKEEQATYLEVFAYDNETENNAGKLLMTMGENLIEVVAEKGKMVVHSVFDGKTRDFVLEDRFKNLRIIKDAHCVEIFVNDGRFTMCETYHKTPETYSYELSIKGKAEVSGVVRTMERYETSHY